MTIQHCIELSLLHFPKNSLNTLDGGGLFEKSLPPFPATADHIEIASNL